VADQDDTGTPALDVEPSAPLARLLSRITGANRLNLRLLVTTNRLERLMAPAANMGFRSQPVRG
jgi:hypothetical protein